MSLTYGLNSPRDLLEKLRREYSRLDQEISSDNFFNFVVTGYHIIDWLKNSPIVPVVVKSEVSSLYLNADIAMCRDIANASKHFTLSTNYKGAVTARTSINSGFGGGRFGAGVYGAGEKSIAVIDIQGKKINSLELAERVLKIWDDFFTKHNL